MSSDSTRGGESVRQDQTDQDAGTGEAMVRVDGLKKYFSSSSGMFGGVTVDTSTFPPIRVEREPVKAVDDVSFDIREGETLGLVGESGCGKSTLGRTILRLLTPTDGNIYYKGRNLAELSGSDLREMRSDIQMIFQDPQSSLDPRMRVGDIVEEPMNAHGMLDAEGREDRAKMLLEKVGLDPHHYNRFPHAFSGGQRQRINLARALSVDPDFIVCDEPVSALDVSIQAQVLNTMEELQDEFGLTYLFIAHDLSVIRHISDRVAVMYLGNIVELAEKEELFENPAHPYTQALLESIPVPDPRESETRGVLEGEVPSPTNPPSGCRFRTRCPKLIAPETYDLTDREWDDVRRFTRAVERHTFDTAPAADLRATFFERGVPGGEAGAIVEEAIDLVASDTADGDGKHTDDRMKWDEATSLLVGSFAEASICARERPAYEVEPEYGDGRHVSACHLHQ
ncbi:ABC transporter ATP-binding protein [Halovivax cerinus]|uniref:ABC transporter ATP-binding protein n=1 Tax=Halovivax cerinus TaxID=1487865 RepID=A0ABD5NRQ1_9EURY|nr:oligopeptide/dipeptide ABC transporter ATP-binding protein [Halovivax cerinus]